MPARTGRSYSVPGKGTVTRSKSGKAKTYTGKGPAPAGTRKVREPTYEEVPTITVRPSGVTYTSGYGSEAAAKRAVKAHRRRARKIRKDLPEIRATGKAASKTSPPRRYEAPPPPDPASTAVRAVTTGIDATTSAMADLGKAAKDLPETRLTHSYGKPTLGTPKLKEIVRADREGRLTGKRRGTVVATPQARRAQKQLKRARRAYAKKATPNISGLLNEEQERFAETLAKETGLPPKLAADWTLKESGASSAGVGGEAGEQNQLGVGYPAHPTSFSQSRYFNNTTPEQAAKATARWMEGKIGAEFGYQAAPSIQQIPKLAKGGASESELRAYIAGPSAWGTGEIPNSPQVSASAGRAGRKVTAKLKRAEKKAKRLGLKTTRSKAAGAGEPAKLAGPFEGSRALVRKIVGTPVRGDKEYGHSTGGDHQPVAGGGSPAAYAQDINGDHPEENEPPYSQATLDTITRNLRKLGADVPKMVLGDPTAGNWEGTVKGYRVQVLTNEGGEVSHIHVGAHYSGESSGATSYPAGGVTFGATDIASYASATGQSVSSVQGKLRKGKLTGLEILERLKKLGVGVPETGIGEASPAPPANRGSVLAEMERKYLGAPA